MKTYDPYTEESMRDLYAALPENLRRMFATICAEQVGYGGVKYISKLFLCSPTTVCQGKQEIDEGYLKKISPERRQRKKGGGRKKKI